MQLTEVTNKEAAKDFIRANVEINKNDPNYIRPLDKDVNDTFDPAKNKTFRFGEATRWILRSDDGNLIGRIAAFTNKKYKNKGDDVPVGGVGFFDCINDQAAADMLFDVAKHWLLQRGMEAMDGPINFGERDRWWGLVVRGAGPPRARRPAPGRACAQPGQRAASPGTAASNRLPDRRDRAYDGAVP